MAGLGTRFPKDRYPLPKPLIDVNGEPMICKAISSLGLSGTWWFLMKQDEYQEKTCNAIAKHVPDAKFVFVDQLTQGPACTVDLLRDYIDKQQEMVVANCDQIMNWNSSLFLHRARLYDGCIVTYHNSTDKNSYARINDQELVVEIKEKQVISNISLNGVHYWRRAGDFFHSVNKMIAANDTAPNGEYYIGPSYNYMINSGLKVGIYHIPNQLHHAIGIPEDLELYLQHIDNALDM
jgi:dTDP-glucose pyrophosphorylase